MRLKSRKYLYMHVCAKRAIAASGVKIIFVIRVVRIAKDLMQVL